jgi:hypothetical protein
MVNSCLVGIAEHPSGPSAEPVDGYRDRCGTREHPFPKRRDAAERATTVSPRGEMNVTRPALHSEGCSVTPNLHPAPCTLHPAPCTLNLLRLTTTQ